MKRILALTVLAAASLPATTIDFEAEAANAGGFLTGIPDSPLAIGLATFTGGELRSAEIGLSADQSGVYATQGVFGSGETNPLTIQFAVPVAGASVYVANGDNTATYTVSDDAGDSVSGSLPSAGAGGARIFSLPGIAIRSIDISSSNADGWNFAIDNVVFVSTPEPGPRLLLLMGFLLLWIPGKGAACASTPLSWRFRAVSYFVTAIKANTYSHRSATVGSTFVARRAGR